MATVYRKSEAGYPVYAFSTSAANAAHFDALKIILKACLVTGYGSKPAAGWELIAEGAQYLVLRNGSRTGYVCFTRPTTSAGHVEIWLAETFTGVVNNVMTGAGLKTGRAANNGVPHKVYIGNLAYSSANTSWYVLADERTALLQVGGSSLSGYEYTGSAASYAMRIYVGEDSAGNFIAVGGENTTSTSSVLGYFSEAAFTALKYPESGLLVGAGSIAIIMPVFDRPANSLATAVFDLHEAPLCPAWWGSGGLLAGKLRGVAVTPLLVAHAASPAVKCLGLTGGLFINNVDTLLPLDGPYAYFMAAVSFPSAAHLSTDHPGFW